ncbi:MAG: DUF29 domain-containing protein [Desulfomicrobium escambiense]|nr:DUF29 domain-containing protein [Desulfomicrobium escambiense]
MGRSDRRALKGHLTNIILHLLKWLHQPPRRGRSWENSIANGRREVGWIIEDSPSLRPQLPALIQDVYREARLQARRETRLPLATFPDNAHSIRTRLSATGGRNNPRAINNHVRPLNAWPV